MMQQLVRTPRQLGNHLRIARKAQGLTQFELGQKAGLRQETISIIENGNAATRVDTLLKVVAYLDLDLVLQSRTTTTSDIFEDIM